MSLIIDLLIIVVTAVFVIDGYKRGLVNAVVRLLSSLISSVMSVFISCFLAAWVYNSFFKEIAVREIQKVLPEAISGNGAAKNASEIYEAMPDFVDNALSVLGIGKSRFVSAVSETTLSIPNVIEEMIRPALITLVMVALSVLMFMILSAIAVAVTKGLTAAVDLANLKTSDKILGALLGLLQVIVMLLIMNLLIYAMLLILPENYASSLSDSIDTTIVYKHIHNLEIPEKAMSLFGIRGQ